MLIPRRPAVFVTLKPHATETGVTFCHILQRVSEKINWADRGIKEGLNIRHAATGARLLELAKDAQRLAQELDNVLDGVARVVQPMKLVSLRVSGLYIQFSVSAQPS